MRSALLAALLLAAPAAAEELAIPADRPGYGDAPKVVPVKHLGVEVGVEAALAGEEVELATPQALLRLGVLPWLEARVAIPDFMAIIRSEGGNDAGYGDIAAGVKAAFPATATLDVSAVAMVIVPTGSEGFSEGWTGTVGGNAALAISDSLSLGAAVAGSLGEVVAGGREWMTGAGVSLGITVGRVGAYGEIFGEKSNGVSFERFAGAGATFCPSPRLQLDGSFVYAGETGNVTLGAGAALLW